MHDENALPLEFRSATTLFSLLRARRLGALELLDLQLSRIERTNSSLNAVLAPGGFVPPPTIRSH